MSGHQDSANAIGTPCERQQAVGPWQFLIVDKAKGVGAAVAVGGHLPWVHACARTWVASVSTAIPWITRENMLVVVLRICEGECRR